MNRAHHTLLRPERESRVPLFEQSLKDLQDDFAELDYLYTSLHKTITDFIKQLHRAKKYIDPESLRWILRQSSSLQESLNDNSNKIKRLHNDTRSIGKTQTNIHFLAKQKAQYFQLLRSQSGIVASLITSTDWQSPSFLHSIQSQAGIQTGKIISTINDYKRDQHLDEKSYEKFFIKEYIDGMAKINAHAYLTNSGMAAFTTILTFLQTEKKVTGPILIGKSIYFENKELVMKIFPNVIEVDEMDSNAINKIIDKKKPSVIVLDSLCNATNIAVPNLQEICKRVSQQKDRDTYIILDNTCLPIAVQPLKLVRTITGKLHLIVLESLNKYHQFGFDKVTAGIVWALGNDAGRIFFTREHAGTNITDSSCYILPKPNRKVLEKRLARIERNTSYLAHTLDNYITYHKSTKFNAIVYPGLPSHPSYAWSKKISFHGSYFVIKFKEKYRNTKSYQRFVKLLIDQARKQDADIVSGTSFGFNTTRVYLTSLRTDYGEPFVRVSLGTENRLELEKIKEVFIEAISKF